MTMQAVFNGAVIAESDDTVVVEGNHYFPADSLRTEYVTPSDTHTHCAWKGEASYYSVNVDGAVAKDSVWYYPTPSEAAREIKDRVAFWKGVEVRPAANGTVSGEPASFEAPEGATC
jgi:uncharacterized protein (DUF427 family)